MRLSQRLRTALVSTRVACGAFALMATSAFAYELIVNGSFEANGGAGSGTFVGWTSFAQPGSQGGFKAQAGTQPTLTAFTVPSPPVGSFAAMSDQSGPGGYALYQDVMIPAGTAATLTARVFVLNQAAELSSPASLDYAAMPNQQARFDLMSPAAAIQDIGVGVLRNLFSTQPGDAAMTGYATITTDVSAFAGQTIRLRFAESDNRQGLNFGVDAVSLTVPGLLASSTSVSSLPNPSVLGQTATFSATLSATGAAPPGGGVTFYADNVAIAGCSAVVPLANVAQCSTAALSLGVHTVRADFAGDSNYSASSGSVVHTVITVPGAPTALAADPRNNAITISFAPPASNGGSAVLGYTAACTPSGGGATVSMAAIASPITVSTLVNGTAYSCTVAANNAAGTGSTASVPTLITPVAITAVVLPLPPVAGGGATTVVVTGASAGCAIAVADWVSVDSMPVAPLVGASAFKFGLLRLVVNGCPFGATIGVNVTYPTAIPPGAAYWKFGKTLANTTAHWYVHPATLVNANTVHFTLTDGGDGDGDLLSDGAIFDPGGLAFPQEVPGVTGMGALLLWLLLAAFAAVFAVPLQRRRRVR